jgi:hypothetical protein
LDGRIGKDILEGGICAEIIIRSHLPDGCGHGQDSREKGLYEQRFEGTQGALCPGDIV